MRASAFACIACVVVVLAGSVRGYKGKEVEFKTCESQVGSLDNGEFMRRAAGGSVQCSGKEVNSRCCTEIVSLFGENGDLPLCMCNRQFLSFALESVPGRHGMDADEYLDLLEACDVPFDGKLTCPGILKERDPEPYMHQQLVTALAIRAISELPISQPPEAPSPDPPAPSRRSGGGAGAGAFPGGGIPGGIPGSFGAPSFGGGVPFAPFPASAPTFLPETVEQPVVTVEEPAPAAPAAPAVPVPAPPATPPVDPPPATPADPAEGGCKGVIQTISEVPNLQNFVDAVQASGLEESLTGDGKIVTVFAPTDEAFSATLSSIGMTKDELFANVDLLKSVLETHIVTGSALRLADLTTGQTLTPLSGEIITYDYDEDIDVALVSVETGANGEIKLRDVKACQAVVQVIDDVLLPNKPELQGGDAAGAEAGGDTAATHPATPPIPPTSSETPKEPAPPVFGPGGCKPVIQEARSRGDLSTFVELAENVGLDTQFGVDFEGTVLIPTNLAFDKFMGELQLSKDVLLADTSKELVAKVLQLHAVPESVTSDGLRNGQELETLLGGREVLKVEKNTDILVNPPGGDPATITTEDIKTCSATVHIIDTVLIPTPAVTKLTVG